MSAYGTKGTSDDRLTRSGSSRKADIPDQRVECPLMTLSGHSMARCYALLSTGWLPALCGKKTMQPIMIAAMTADAIGRLKASPP